VIFSDCFTGDSTIFGYSKSFPLCFFSKHVFFERAVALSIPF
jgi:hypothetical protein